MSSTSGVKFSWEYKRMAVGDIYQVSYFQDIVGQAVVNVFHYLQVSANTAGLPAEDLAEGFEVLVAPAYEDILAVGWEGLGTEVINIGSLLDFDVRTYTSPFTGGRTGQRVANSICWSFRLNRLGPGQRSGWKRLSCIAESDVNGQTPDAGIIAALDVVAGILGDTFEAGGALWSPAVVKRPIVYGVAPTVFYLPITVDFRGVGTQVSRKQPFS